jgi:hypothetical protein
MNLFDHNRRLADLEVALESLARALVQAGHAPIVEDAIRRARAEGVKGADDLLMGARRAAAYRRA